MSDLYGEFLDALHEVQRASGLGAIRLGRLLGVSRYMMKSLLAGRRRPGLRTVAFMGEGCEVGFRRLRLLALLLFGCPWVLQGSEDARVLGVVLDRNVCLLIVCSPPNRQTLTI